MKVPQFVFLSGILYSYYVIIDALIVSPLYSNYLRGRTHDDVEKLQTAIWTKFTRKGASIPCLKTPSFGINTRLCGIEMFTDKARPISAFKGIKYASVTERFKPPTKAGNWTGTLAANKFGPQCAQLSQKTKKISGQEDCLYLNVFVPQHVKTLLPVIVFVHGGSFLEGSSNFYSPAYFLNKDVILVTINYRLGPLGSFTLLSSDAPGNAGLYDILEALKWVNSHIYDFGGDKTRITLMGNSAGAASVNYLLYSPLSKGLVHRGIQLSGTALDKWALNEESLKNNIELANAVGCGINLGSKVILLCMKKVSVQNLFSAQLGLIWNDQNSGKLGLDRAAPNIQDSYTTINNPIVPQHPKTLMQQELQLRNIPVMVGTTKDEGSFILGITYTNNLRDLNLHKNAEFLRHKLIPYFVDAYLGFGESNGAISKSMQSLYCRGVNLANFTAAAPCLNDFLGVLSFKAGADEVAKLISQACKPAFLYSFNRESNDTLYQYVHDKVEFDTGVSHSDDLMYLFPLTQNPDKNHLKVKDKMIELWTNFATYGDPTPVENEMSWKSLGISKWKSYDRNDQNYLEITNECILKKKFINSWSSL